MEGEGILILLFVKFCSMHNCYDKFFICPKQLKNV